LRRVDWGKVDLESEKRKAALWIRTRHENQDLKLSIAEKMGDMPFNDRREPILDGYTAVSDYNIGPGNKAAIRSRGQDPQAGQTQNQYQRPYHAKMITASEKIT
jgi:hypothetical protein|tara:strand:- start:42 stop:353 length:312 start_codon:yes stop_codon:yes gene_type:complete